MMSDISMQTTLENSVDDGWMGARVATPACGPNGRCR